MYLELFHHFVVSVFKRPSVYFSLKVCESLQEKDHSVSVVICTKAHFRLVKPSTKGDLRTVRVPSSELAFLTPHQSLD